MSKRALVVEDDANIAELLRLYLGKDGFDVMIAADGGKAESSFDLFQPDVVLLDIMLPVKDGWEVCRDIRRKSSTPIIMLTAKGETSDKISGLEMGADDYVTKPFDIMVLKARVRALLRRASLTAPGGPGSAKTLQRGHISVDEERRTAWKDGVPVELTLKEFDLILFLMKNPGRVYSREALLDLVWGYEYQGDTRTVDVHIRRLREKLELDPAHPDYIATKWGVGYYFSEK